MRADYSPSLDQAKTATKNCIVCLDGVWMSFDGPGGWKAGNPLNWVLKITHAHCVHSI